MTGQLDETRVGIGSAEHSDRDRLLEMLAGSADTRFPSSYAQRRQWILQERSPYSTAYVMPWGVKLSGPVDIPALQRALDAVVTRHEALRTSFDPSSGGSVQVVHAAVRVQIEQRIVSTDLTSAAAEALMVAFDLSRAPLLRVTLWSSSPDGPDNTGHLLTFIVHHSVVDGASVEILLRDLSVAYRETRMGRCPNLGPPPTQPADHAVWEAAEVTSDGFGPDLAHWDEVLDGRYEGRSLPADRVVSSAPTGPLGRVERAVDPRRAAGVDRLAADLGTTPFAVLLTAYWISLSRYAGRHDLVVGVPVSGRTRPQIADTVGLFVNTLPVRLQRCGARTGAQLVTTVHRALARAIAHQRVPLDLVAERMSQDARRRGSVGGDSQIFDTVFTSQDEPDTALLLDGMRAVPADLRPGHTKADLTCVPVRRKAQLYIQWDFRTDLYDPRTVDALAGTFDRVLDRLIDHRDDDVEVHGIGSTPRTATDDIDVTKNLLHVFAEVAATRAEIDAVVDHETRLSYRELDRRSNRLAHHLRSLGVRDETAVGICLPRSAELAVACLAVLKSGGSYLPIDPAFPAERAGFMLADSGASLIIGAGLVEPDPAVTVVNVADASEDLPDTPLDLQRHPHSLGLRIYTSGSTGRPKAVGVTLDGIVRLVHPGTYGGFGPDRRVLWISAVSFDVATWEIWGTLLHGATGIVSGPREYDAAAVRATIRRHGVTTALFSTALFNSIADVDPTTFDGLSDLLIGGEALSVTHVRAVAEALPQIRLANAYGPAEITTIATCRTVSPEDLSGSSIPIGHPVAGTRTVIAGPDGRTVSPGAQGELWLSGDGLVRGYLNKPRLTAERFVPAAGGQRWYRSGDLAREAAPEELVYLGRTDRQVKVRGYRVEPGELEAVLVERPEVAQAAVISTQAPDGSRQLVAFVVPAAGALEDLQIELRRSVPSYLVPTAVHSIRHLPTTVNGKVDLVALDHLHRDLTPIQRSVATAELSGHVEHTVAGVCQRVLSLPMLPGPDDDFFALGGNSLLAATFVARLHECIGTPVPLVAVFDHPVLHELAALISASGGSESKPVEAPSVSLAPRPAPLSPAQQRLFFLEQLDPETSVFNIPLVADIHGEIDSDLLAAAVRTVVLRHEVLRCRIDSDGPTRRQVVVADEEAPALRVVDLEGEPDPIAAAHELIETEVRRPFDLVHGDLPMRATLLKVAPQQHFICLVLHHIVADGWSVGVLSAELSTAYKDLRAGRESTLPPLSVQYVDIAHAQGLETTSDAYKSELQYWIDHLRGAPQTVDLPTVRPRPARRRQHGAWHRFSVDSLVRDEVERLARNTGGTPFIVLLAAFSAVIADAAGQDELLVGTPVANRTRAGAEHLVGLFANTLALRIDTSGKLTGTTLVERITRVALEALAHSSVQFEAVVEELVERRDVSRTPLIQVMFSLDNTPSYAPSLDGVVVTPIDVNNPAARCDLTISMRTGETGLEGICEYDSDLLAPDEVDILVTRFVALLTQITANPEERLDKLQAGAPVRLQGPKRAADLDLWELLQARAATTPHDIALIDTDGSVLTLESLVQAVRQRSSVQALSAGPRRVSLDFVLSVLAECAAGLAKSCTAMQQSYAGVREQTDWWRPGESVGVLVGTGAASALSVIGPLAGGCRVVLIDPARGPVEVPRTVMGGTGTADLMRAGWSPRAGGRLIVPVEIAAEVEALWPAGQGRPRVCVMLWQPTLEFVAAGPDVLGLTPRLDRTLLPEGWLGVARDADNVAGPIRIGELVVHDGLVLHHTGHKAFVGQDGSVHLVTGSDLQSRDAAVVNARIEDRAPQSPTELAVCDIWADLLSTEGSAVVVHDVHADFFSLGGQSFLAARLAARLTRTFGAHVALHEVFESPTVAQQAAKIDRSTKTAPIESASPPRRASQDHEAAPLTPAQERLWFLHQLAPESPAYNIPLVAILHGEVNKGALERAARWVVDRHEALRIAVLSTPEGLRQDVHPSGPADVVEWLPDSGTEQEALVDASAAAWQPFDLAAGESPIRFTVGSVATKPSVLTVTVHHIVADGWAVGVIVRDLCLAYSCFVDGAEPTNAGQTLSWSDWATSSRATADSQIANVELEHWQHVLEGAPRTLDLPASHPRPEIRAQRGHSLPVRLSGELTGELRALAANTGCTAFMVLEAAFAVTLSKFAGSTDVVVGTPVAGRYAADEENLVGLLANTVVLRTDLRTTRTVRDLLASSRKTCLEAFEHQLAPFERVVEQLGVERDPSRSPVFQVMFAFNDVPRARIELPALIIQPVEPENPTAKFDIVLNLADRDDTVSGVCEYDAEVYDAEMVRRLIDHFVRTIEVFTAEPDAVIASLDLLDPAERQALIFGFNRTTATYQADQTLTSLVEDAVDRWPARVAVTEAATGRQLSYVQLDRTANALAEVLINAGATGTVVGLYAARTLDLVIGEFAVLKTGSGFLPLDPAWPDERRNQILLDANCDVVVYSGACPQLPDGVRGVPVHATKVNPASRSRRGVQISPQQPAYVIYTSGSTGKPKGVVIPHAGIVNNLLWMQQDWPLGADDRMLQKTTSTFDVSVKEIFWPLLAGAHLVLAEPDSERDPEAILRQLDEHAITITHLVPSVLDLVLDTAERREVVVGRSLRYVMCGAETLSVATQRRYARRCTADLLHMYGPTETSVAVTGWTCPAGEQLDRVRVPLGRPMPHSSLFVLDEGLLPAPHGTEGELHVGGTPVALGYLGRPRETAAAFVPDPFSAAPGSRMYRTGDRVRLSADNLLEFAGRRDNQVKVRGHRVELGEIEAALCSQTDVRQAVVVPIGTTQSDTHLIAYVVVAQEREHTGSIVDQDGVHGRAIRNQLIEKLPRAFVPSRVVVLAELPLTTNGKVDRHALVTREVAVQPDSLYYLAPRNKFEATVADVWAQVLGLGRVGAEDDFFSLGGHSLQAVAVSARLQEIFSVEIALRDVLAAPTVARVAELVQSASAAPVTARIPSRRRRRVSSTGAQEVRSRP